MKVKATCVMKIDAQLAGSLVFLSSESESDERVTSGGMTCLHFMV